MSMLQHLCFLLPPPPQQTTNLKMTSANAQLAEATVLPLTLATHVSLATAGIPKSLLLIGNVQVARTANLQDTLITPTQQVNVVCSARIAGVFLPARGNTLAVQLKGRSLALHLTSKPSCLTAAI